MCRLMMNAVNPMNKTLVTIDGHIGSGALVVGRKIARMFGWRYFHRVRLPRIDDASDDIALDGEMEDADFSDRLWDWIERAASYFAVGAAGDDPLLQGAADIHRPLTWDRNGPAASESAYDLNRLAKSGNAVIVHRAGAVELADHEDAARVGIFADWDDRVKRVMNREGIKDVAQAEHIIFEREKAQREYFFKMHQADPEDPGIYDFIVNTSDNNIHIATLQVSRYVKKSRDRVAV
jgi:cytidylate kinase